MRHPRNTHLRSASREGITLLEVLISCGILVIGLTSLSAMLAAAGVRLTQATIEDRAAVAATNALAEVKNRGLAAASAFGGRKAVLVFGNVIEALADLNGQSPWFSRPSTSVSARCGSPRTFQLEDDLMYESGQLMGSLANAFTSQNQTVAIRAFRPGVCWGATLTCFPHAVGNAADAGGEAVEGASAELAVAVFKRAADQTSMRAVTLTKCDDGLSYEYLADVGSPEPPLRACSWVMAIPADTSATPRWFRIRASWTMEPLASNLPRVILDDKEEFETLTASANATNTASVIVFDGLVRLDKHTVILD